MELLFKLDPALSFKIWGGDKLAAIKGVDSKSNLGKPGEKLGETWEISTHKDGPSKLSSNKTGLNELVDLSYLLKYIDTSDNLSVQVHPGDEYAQEHENEMGKTECWLILDSKPDAEIYLGFLPGVTRKEFKTALEAGLNVDGFLTSYKVSPGDFFVVPAGAVHAIGTGVTLVEVQQSSGITYRVWDWNRVGDDGKPRELHIDKALDVLRFDDSFNKQLSRLKKAGVYSEPGTVQLFKHRDFSAQLINLSKGDAKEIRIASKEGISLLRGKALIDDVVYEKFESAIASNDGLINITALEDCSLLCVKNRED